MIRLALAFLVLTPLAVQAAPDPQPSEPYRWRILVRTPRHPIFTEVFREQLARELKAALQPGIGLLGAVEVIDTSKATDAVTKAFHSNGWTALEANASKPLDNTKHHGLNIDYRDGTFVLTARQYDGFTGLNSPLLRTRTVRSLDQIPRSAALLLEPDFGFAGTIERSGTDESLVMLTFRGHTLAPLENRVKIGDVFAVSLVKENNNTLTGAVIPFTLVKAIEPVKDGQCRCRILSRWANPFGRDSRRAAALRAMKLTTVQSPLRVQLVDRAGKPHARGSTLTLTASDLDFTAKATPTDGFEWRDGLFRSTRSFANIACFSVSVGADRAQLFPVPILNDDVIMLAFDINPEAERRALFLRDCSDLRARIADLSTAQLAMVTGMNKMIDDAQNKDALKRAENGKDSVNATEKALGEELKHLGEQPGASDTTAKEVLESCTRQLAVIREGQAGLIKTIEILKGAVSKTNTPAALEKELRIPLLVGRIKEHLIRGDVPEALLVYDELIALAPSQASLKDEREKLRAEWTPKDDAHRIARECIRSLAGAKQSEDFKAACEAIKKAMPVFKQKGDRLGLRKLLNTFELAIPAYYTLLNASDTAPANPENAEMLSKLNDTLTDLRQCHTLVEMTLKDLAGAEKK